MDLTPQTLREVEFREKLRGYHPDDVDDFLEEVAIAVGVLLARVHAAESGLPSSAGATWTDVRPAAAPAVVPAPLPHPVGLPAAEGVGDAPASETLRRTLLLAQRTADLAIAEAENSARQIVEHAEAEAQRIKDEAQVAVAAMMEEATARSASMVGDLEAKRSSLEREVASLHTWASQHRDRIREALNDQIRSLDVWLSTNPPPRPTRPAPALRATSSGGLSARRALGTASRPRPTRLGTPGTDADHPIEGGVLRRPFSREEDDPGGAASADDAETPISDQTDSGDKAPDGISPEGGDTPESGRGPATGGLGSRLYRRR